MKDDGLVERKLRTKYWLGDLVYQRIVEDKRPGIITGIGINGTGGVFYEITWPNAVETPHFDYELTSVFIPDYAQDDDGDEDDRQFSR